MANQIIRKDATYKTRDGRDVRIYATDASGLFPVHGAIAGSLLFSWPKDGQISSTATHPMDLIEVKPLQTRWVNMYPDYNTYHQSRERADAFADVERIARLKVTFTEGQFDE